MSRYVRFAVVALAVACSDKPTGSSTPDASLADASEPVRDAGETPDTGPANPSLEGIRLEPPAAELESVNGSKPSVTFVAVGAYSDGVERNVSGVTYSVDTRRVADVGASTGEVVANGFIGGMVRVRARIALGGTAYEADAVVTVKIVQEVASSQTAKDVFGGTPIMDLTRASGVVYPLAGAVMPENVYPPDIQWVRGDPGDFFHIALSKPDARLDAYVEHTGADFLLNYRPEVIAWRRLAVTNPESPLEIRVDRYVAATQEIITDTPTTMRFAQAALSGTIYYWDIAAGRIVSIQDGTAQSEAFMPSPPLGCVGCHSVSRSGRYMAGRFGGGENIGGVFDLTQDLTTNPPPLQFPISSDPPSTRWWFSSWSPDDARMIVSYAEGGSNGSLQLMDPATGALLTPGGNGLPASGSTHPNWSPDGTAIAYISGVDQWGGANTRGDVSIIPVTGSDTFGAPTTIVLGDTLATTLPNGTACSYPTWTPDSRFVAFAHGSSSRSENGAAALFLVAKDGSGLIRMDRASGGADKGDNFQPAFSPFQQGGYFWMSYLSRRDYGNSRAGTMGSNRQQIWVSAVKVNPNPGEDPSEVGYWLPGQNTQSMNISAYWAPKACRADGESCAVAAECCGGDCRPDTSGALVCAPRSPDQCLVDGTSCDSDDDCCGGLCIAGLCGGF